MAGRRAGANSASLTDRLREHLARTGRGTGPDDLGEVTRHCLAAAVRTLGRAPAPTAQPAEIVGSAVRWAREGVALETVLGAYHDGIRSGLEFLAAEAEADDPEEVVAGARLIVRALEMVTLAASTAYVEEHRVVAKEHQTAAQTLVSALLAGRGVERVARQAGIAIAPAYQVVAVHIPPHPDESGPGGGTVAARYKLRRVQAALADPLGSRALSLLSTNGGTVLVPVEATAAALTPPTVTAEVLEWVGNAAGVPMTAAVATGPTERVPELADLTHDLLHRVRASGRAPGLYPVIESADGEAAASTGATAQAHHGAVDRRAEAEHGRAEDTGRAPLGRRGVAGRADRAVVGESPDRACRRISAAAAGRSRRD
ncbi:transcriptional regulator [Nocardia takedensis]|uniref:transcriptional regulator n=1 Tax=Nocardia takedensis TaxID=259390 RepID=UPI0015753AA7|nr:transcriptional regulator [Nocardia takedensis]